MSSDGDPGVPAPQIATTADRTRSRRPNALVYGWFWILDYLYAARRQLALLALPWTIWRPRPAPARWSEGSSGLPHIVLLPGVYEHWTFLRPLGDALNRAGHRVEVVHRLGVNRRTVAETAERVSSALARQPAPPAGRVLVAHSKGGLIGKQVMVTADATHDTDEGILGLVAVCTPFSGSHLAAYLWDPSIRAFLPDNETIVALGSATSVNSRIVSVFGRFDPHIPAGSVLDGATNVEVPGNGHFRVLGDATTHRAVVDGVALLSSGRRLG